MTTQKEINFDLRLKDFFDTYFNSSQEKQKYCHIVRKVDQEYKPTNLVSFYRCKDKPNIETILKQDYEIDFKKEMTDNKACKKADKRNLTAFAMNLRIVYLNRKLLNSPDDDKLKDNVFTNNDRTLYKLIDDYFSASPKEQEDCKKIFKINKRVKEKEDFEKKESIDKFYSDHQRFERVIPDYGKKISDKNNLIYRFVKYIKDKEKKEIEINANIAKKAGVQRIPKLSELNLSFEQKPEEN